MQVGQNQLFKNKSLIINIMCTILYAIFTLILVMHHEIWADEAQVWQICRHLSVFELFKHLVNEGHPSFFYLLMMPVAKLWHGVGSIFFMQIVCWFSMVVSVFLFLQFSPFSRFTKFAVVTSCGFLYFFPVIARSYSILPLLVFVLAILYPRSDKHPFWYAALIFMLANTHVIMFAFCGMLTLDFVYNNIIKKWKAIDIISRRNCLICAGLMFVGLLVVVLQLLGTTSSNVVIKIDVSNWTTSLTKVLSQYFINAVDNQWPELHTIMFPLFNVPAILLSMLIYCVIFAILLWQDKKLFCIAFLGILFQIIVYTIGYSHWVFVNRIFCGHIILLFCLWIFMSKDEVSSKIKTVLNISLSVFFLFMLMNGLKYSIFEIKYNYSSAKETAEFIKKNIDKDSSVIVTDNDPYAIAVVYYLNEANEIYSGQHDYNIKYVIWDKKMFYMLSSSGWNEYAEFVLANRPYFKNKKIYALMPMFNVFRLLVTDLQNYNLIYQSSPAVVKFEGFRIYEYKGQSK